MKTSANSFDDDDVDDATIAVAVAVGVVLRHDCLCASLALELDVEIADEHSTFPTTLTNADDVDDVDVFCETRSCARS